ncbi:hypothetical protein [Jiella avicenniae]|uniref:Uncharacterized protein n=1 Tax=Jiella avicenniae TaxID=2907202 RepID=A0A9X1NWC7_9HYPH|nr:hypothetical protein [Jiella avicenniae]MCE7026737.1 hypothetical protein [Jiella avicenniae]
MRHLYLAATAAMALTLSACGDDNAARVTELEGQLQTTQSENEALQGQIRDLEAAQEAASGQIDPTTLREPLTTAFTAMGETEQQLDRFAETLQREGYDNVSLDPLRNNIRDASQAVAGAARDVGVDVDAILAEARSAVENTSSSNAPDVVQPGAVSAGGEAEASSEEQDAAATQPAE